MSKGVRLFHSSIKGFNYVLVKPTEKKVFLYKLEPDGSIKPDAKPLMKKTYKKYSITRRAFFPHVSEVEDYLHRYNSWYSDMPRRNIESLRNCLRPFTIRNKSGVWGDVVSIKGCIDNEGNIDDVFRLKCPMDRHHRMTDVFSYYHCDTGISNLARKYLKKIFSKLAQIPPNWRHVSHISLEERKELDQLYKEHNIPPFKITDKMQESMDALAQKHSVKQKKSKKSA